MEGEKHYTIECLEAQRRYKNTYRIQGKKTVQREINRDLIKQDIWLNKKVPS